ncbi:MAG: hypothetical protein V3R83_12275 [Gammaproteobacteria bacterium]
MFFIGQYELDERRKHLRQIGLSGYCFRKPQRPQLGLFIRKPFKDLIFKVRKIFRYPEQ